MNVQTFFDMLALPFWIFLIIGAAYELKKGIKNWKIYTRLIIGFIALIVDSSFVLRSIFSP
ncbi:hypothetical protein HZA33_02810 [Candidatus Pacearchaeota archaeon]|nr:hypothetical protein [Candidatus Pacearchaeota archaeon]